MVSSSPKSPTLADFDLAKNIQQNIRARLDKMGLKHMPNLPLRELAVELAELRLTSTFPEPDPALCDLVEESLNIARNHPLTVEQDEVLNTLEDWVVNLYGEN